MGIDYLIDQPCAVKDAFGGAAGFVALAKQRGQAEAILQMARRQGDERPLDQIKIRSKVARPGGVEEREVSLQELLDAPAPLAAHEQGCAGCPAHFDERPFSCYGYVGYPIAAEAEKWLLSRLPKSLESTAGMFLLKALDDFGWDGEHVAGMREKGRTFFESDATFAASWGEGRDARAIDSNTLLEMMFFVGHVQPSHALMLCLFLGLLPHDIAPGDLQSILHDAQGLRQALRMPQVEDAQVLPMCRFLSALATGAWLGKNLVIDG